MSLFRLEVDLPEQTSHAIFGHLANVLEHAHCKHVPDDSGPALGVPGRTVFFLETTSTEAEADVKHRFTGLVHEQVSKEAQVFVKQIQEESEG